MNFSVIEVAFSSVISMAVANALVALLGISWGKARGDGIKKKDRKAEDAFSKWKKSADNSANDVIENDLAVEQQRYTRDFAISMVFIGSFLFLISITTIYLMWKATFQESPHLYKYISYLGGLPYSFVNDYGFLYLSGLIFFLALLIFRYVFFNHVISKTYCKEKIKEMECCPDRNKFERVKINQYIKEKYRWFFGLRGFYIPLISIALLFFILNIFVSILLLGELGDYSDDYLLKFHFLNVPSFAGENYKNLDWGFASNQHVVFYTLYVDGEEKMITNKHTDIKLRKNLPVGWHKISVTARSLGMVSKEIEEAKNIYILPNINVRLNTNNIRVGEVIFPEFSINTRGTQYSGWKPSEGLIDNLHNKINETNPNDPIALEEIQNAIKYYWFVDGDIVSNEPECIILPEYYDNGTNKLRFEMEINGTRFSTKPEIITPGYFSNDSIICKLSETTDIILSWNPVDNAEKYSIIYNDGNTEGNVYLTTINNKAVISKDFLSQFVKFKIRIYSRSMAYYDTDIEVDTKILFENSGIDITSFLE